MIKYIALFIISVFLLSACAQQRIDIYDESFDAEFSKTYHPVLSAEYQDADWTTWNKSMFLYAIAGQVADVISTASNLDNGCVEKNSIYGENPSAFLLVAIKSVAMGIAYFAIEDWIPYSSPEQQQYSRNIIYGTFGTVGAGAAIWNMNQRCD